MALPAPAIALLAAEQLLHCTYESFGLRDRKCALLRQSKVYHFSQNPRSHYRPLHPYNHCDVSKWRLRSLVSELAGFFTLCWYSGDRSAEAIELKDLEPRIRRIFSRNRKRALYTYRTHSCSLFEWSRENVSQLKHAGLKLKFGYIRSQASPNGGTR